MHLVVEDLGCRRAGRRVLARVSFRLAARGALVVTGRNGAGKSTLIAAISGSVRPETGTIRWEGAGEATLGECAHLVGHRDALKGALSAAENLAFAAAVLGGAAAVLGPPTTLAPAEALARVGLPGAANLPVAYLSAGQRRRVALARLLVARRPLWLLDEPLTALDAGGQAMLLGLLREHLAGGGLLVAATHAPLDLPGATTLRLGPPEDAA